MFSWKFRVAGAGAVLAVCLATAAAAKSCATGTPTPVRQTWSGAKVTIKGTRFVIFTGPIDYGHQLQIASGISNSLWVALSADNAIMKFSVTGHAEIYATPAQGSNPEAIALNGMDMWFTEFNTGCFGSINKFGKIVEHDDGLGENESTGMATGAKGLAWFVSDQSAIGKISAQGRFTLYHLPDQGSQPTAITLGPDGKMWFVESVGSNIGNIGINGVIKEYATNFSGANSNYGIASGSDGRIWFADSEHLDVGASTIAGHITYYGGFTCAPESIVAGPDSNLYVGESCGIVARLTTSGAVTEFPLPQSDGSFPVISLTVGPDGNIWFTNNAHSQIGALVLKKG